MFHSADLTPAAAGSSAATDFTADTAAVALSSYY